MPRNNKRKAEVATEEHEAAQQARQTRSRRISSRIEPAAVPVVVDDKEVRIPVVKKERKKPKSTVKVASHKFVKATARSWFQSLCVPEPDSSEENTSKIGPSGVQKLADEIGQDVGDIVFFVMAWKMEAQEVGCFTEEEWMTGMTELQVDTASKLKAKWEDLRAMLDDIVIFRNVYRFAYDLTKENGPYCRLIETEIAQELITVFLGQRWALCSDFCDFLDAYGIKSINKDQYNNVLEFHLMVKDDCSDYDMNSAWPVLIDDFVTYLHAKTLHLQDQETDLNRPKVENDLGL